MIKLHVASASASHNRAEQQTRKHRRSHLILALIALVDTCAAPPARQRPNPTCNVPDIRCRASDPSAPALVIHAQAYRLEQVLRWTDTAECVRSAPRYLDSCRRLRTSSAHVAERRDPRCAAASTGLARSVQTKANRTRPTCPQRGVQSRNLGRSVAPSASSLRGAPVGCRSVRVPRHAACS